MDIQLKAFVEDYFKTSIGKHSTIDEFLEVIFQKFYSLELVKECCKHLVAVKDQLEAENYATVSNPKGFFMVWILYLFKDYTGWPPPAIRTYVANQNLLDKYLDDPIGRSKSILECVQYWYSLDEYTVLIVTLYANLTRTELVNAWKEYFRIYRLDIHSVIEKVNKRINNQLLSGVKPSRVDLSRVYSKELESVEIVKDNTFIAKELLSVKVSTILGVPNNSTKDYYLDSSSSRWQGITGELGFRSVSDKINTRLYSQWLFRWFCTDTYVGLRAFYLDEKLVALAYQTTRKNCACFYWTSDADREAVVDYLSEISLNDEEKQIYRLKQELKALEAPQTITILDMESEEFSDLVWNSEELTFSVFDEEVSENPQENS